MNESGSTLAVMESGDALGAVSALKAFKNFMFIVAIICLLVVQGAFWLNYLGLIDKTCCPCGKQVEPAGEPDEVVEEAAAPVVALAAQVEEATSGTDEPDATGEAEAVAEECEEGAFDLDAILEGVKNPACQHVVCAIGVCNYVGFFALILYCLGLLMTVKISIAGRLGGINHITRAFLVSLIAVVLAIPWQVCFGEVVAGAMFTPAELLCAEVVTCDAALEDCAFYFGRFTVLWAIVVVLLLVAQIHTMGWSKAVRRRMGILKPKTA